MNGRLNEPALLAVLCRPWAYILATVNCRHSACYTCYTQCSVYIMQPRIAEHRLMSTCFRIHYWVTVYRSAGFLYCRAVTFVKRNFFSRFDERVLKLFQNYLSENELLENILEPVK